ncbi:MAG: type II toxin-antitoxin system VapC family toxin [Candidatus Helarchaeota archaeon]
MAFFIDSGVWIAAYNIKDQYHPEGCQIVTAVVEGKLRQVQISDYIFDEILTYIRKKIGVLASIKVANAMLDSPHLQIIHVDESTFQASFHIFQMYEQLSFTDATTVVIMKNHRITNLFSFDSGFDGIRGIIRFNKLR